MLSPAAKARMTGIEINGPTAATATSTTANNNNNNSIKSPNGDDMLTTPKFLPDSAHSSGPLSLLSPRTSTFGPSTSSSIAATVTTQQPEDMLTTPVLTTPKTSDLWQTAKRSAALDSLAPSFSPENLSLASPSSPTKPVGPREPPKDLPMDSDIGLRSPCDGLLAKRRKFKTQQAASTNSDSNSCDTPTSQNSPRDLSTTSSSTTQTSKPEETSSKIANGSRVQVKLEFEDETGATKSKSIRSPGGSSKSPLLPPSRNSGFKLPGTSNKPEGLRFNDLPSQYTPSPGLNHVPSPNWSTVDRYATELRTPKQLEIDNNVFDFLGTPHPITPRSKLLRSTAAPGCGPGDHSPSYTNREHLSLSPRLSPRFPIPEAPTDLSSKQRTGSSSGNSSGSASDPPPYPEAAEDLSMVRKTATPPAIPPQKVPEAAIVTALKQEQQQQQQDPRSRTPSGHSTTTVQGVIKTEVDDFEYRHASLQQQQQPAAQHSHLHAHIQQQQAIASGLTSMPPFPPSFVLQRQQFLYGQRGVYGARSSPDMSYDSVAAAAEAAGYPHGGVWPSHHPQFQDHARPPWPTEEDDHSVSPPLGYHQQSQQQQHIMPQSMALLNSGSVRRPSLSPGLQRQEDGGEKRKKAKTATLVNGERKKKSLSGPKKAKEPPVGPNGSKRVYTCPHCQRSYDWNYNLNRHLKYECGKENAFQCAKCGRKFPHKQNCVYHLKRKHKIVCDSIDQYMSAGLVLFRGSAGPSGQQTAKPAPEDGPTPTTNN